MGRRLLVSLFAAICMVFGCLGVSPAASAHNSKSRLRDVVQVIENGSQPRSVVISIVWLQDGVSPRRQRTVIQQLDQFHWFKFRGTVGQNYRIVVIDPDDGGVLVNRRFVLRRGGFGINLPSRTKPAVEQTIEDLRAQIVALQGDYAELKGAKQEGETALRAQIATLQQEVAERDAQIEALQALLAQQPSSTERGLIVGIVYNGPYVPPKFRQGIDATVRISFYNDSIYQCWIRFATVRFWGPAVPASTAAFAVDLVSNQNDAVIGQSTATWDAAEGAWVANFLLNQPLSALASLETHLSLNSASFANAAAATDLLYVAVVDTESFDGRTVFRGPDHSSGTVVVEYE